MQDLVNKESSLEKGIKSVVVSMVVVALLGVTKGMVGFFAGSIALIAQAVDSVTDVFASITVYVGLKIAERELTEKFPYGYYRAETFASLVIAVLIVVSGVGIAREAVMQLLRPTAIAYSLVALSVGGVSVLLLYPLARHVEKVGEEVNSRALLAQAKDYFLDMYSSLLVFAGILLSYLGVLWMEPLIAGVVSILILKNGFELGRDAVLTLMDAAVEPEHVERIRRLAEDTQGVIGVHDIKIRKSGPVLFGELHLEVEEALPVEKAHRITKDVQSKARQEYEELESLTIHMEPARRKKFRIAIPVRKRAGLESPPEFHLGNASHFMIVDVNQKRIQDWSVQPNPGAEKRKKRGVTAAKLLIEKDVNVLLVGKLGEPPFHMLRDAMVKVYKLPRKRDVQKVLDMFLEGELEELDLPP
jgi:cation diffusion facilitator family transporter